MTNSTKDENLLSNLKKARYLILVTIFTFSIFGRKFQNLLRELPSELLYLSAAIALVSLAIPLRLAPKRAIIISSLIIGLGFLIQESFINFPAERAHFVKYSLLGMIVSLEKVYNRSSLKFVIPLVFVLLVGVADETVQYFVPDRFFDPLDILYNIYGGSVGCLAVHLARVYTKPDTAS